MSYFSRVLLNPTRSGTRRLLSSAQAVHAVVMGSFVPAGGGAADGRVLWRLDRSGRDRLELYVVSPTPPDFTGLIEQAGWPATQTWDSTSYDGFLSRLEDGQTWRFRLTANPVRSKAAGEGARGRVSPHVTVAQQEEWLLQRASGWGFTVPLTDGSAALVVRERETARFGRSNGAARHTVSVTRARYDGVLQVTDPNLLRKALVHGCGRAKAYGCGLMTLVQPS